MQTTDIHQQMTPFTRREMILYAVGFALLLSFLFIYNILTLVPELSGFKLLLYAMITLALIVEYGYAFTHIEQILPFSPRLMMAIMILVAGLFLFGIIQLLGARASPYIFLVIFDGYTVATVMSLRYSLIMVTTLTIMVALSFLQLSGWQQGALIFLDQLIWIVLATMSARVFVRQWRQRFQVEQLLEELKEANTKLRDYTKKSEELAISRERVRLAHDLHDTVGHSLTALNMQIALLSRLPDQKMEERRRLLEQARILIKQGLSNLRRAVQALRPLALDGFSLVDALARLIEDFERDRSLTVEKKIEDPHSHLTPEVALPIYLSAQEALTNIRRHAPTATRVVFSLTNIGDGIQLELTNDGIEEGSDLQTAESGYGLLGMKERCHMLGGSFQANIESNHFHLKLTWPVGREYCKP